MWIKVDAVQTKPMIQRPSDPNCYSNLVITDPSGSGAFRSGRRVRPAALLNQLTSPSL